MTADPAADPATVRWRRVGLAGLDAAVDLLDGPPMTVGTYGGATYVVQTAGPVALGVWHGPGKDLEAFRSGFGPAEVVTLGAETPARVAGLPARTQTGQVAGGLVATGLVAEPDGELGHVDVVAREVTHVALAWVLDGTPVLMRWQVETAQRDRWRAAEEHFLGSVSLS